ncbi:glutamine--tRNA ligase/YqeY domain fusion protein [Granulosicoccaceae sp. 1_MG-2023]|nr:glutamine--tRNA ligase/YqeY domain fusion protein [Granulosicoccaceae sp. 1_MG-2023]
MSSDAKPSNNFIRHLVSADLEAGKHGGRLQTRFPPEPNGYLHIGHAKSICLNFGLARDYGGQCNLRFDDTNPEKEDAEYEQAIQSDVEWLGFSWSNLCHASDYYQQLYDYAVELIRRGCAYVDSLSAEEIREYRGSLTEPGKPSPYRERSVEENLDLFERMREGEFADGEHVLRARIDMASGNMNMRDPTLYRIRRHTHYRTGDQWCIYPMYDYAHCLSDAIENVTHSLCTLEFEDHRPLYDWVLASLEIADPPKQTEFAPLNLEYTILSKRKLIQLVREKIVDGWDDPRMPTITGLRRRGFTPAAIREFCERIGVTKNDASIEMPVLENVIRDDLNTNALRRMAVLDPIKVVITNYPQDHSETLSLPNHPQNPEAGTRDVLFGGTVYIERDDFAEVPPPKFKRLVPGGEVRLRGSYVIRCDEVIKDDKGEITELRCSYDENTLGKNPEGRKVKGVIHWVNAETAVTAEVRIYEPLFKDPNPAAAEDFLDCIRENSKTVLTNCKVEPALAEAAPETNVQFERQGYFVADRRDHSPARPVFNRTITLRDSWGG